MTVTVLATVTFAKDQAEALTKYLEVTAPLLQRAQAQVKTVFELNEAVVGNRPAKQLIIVEYPNREAVDMVFKSPEYKALIPTRDKAFSTYDVTIADQLGEASLPQESDVG